jgi:hypothetical protein
MYYITRVLVVHELVEDSAYENSDIEKYRTDAMARILQENSANRTPHIKIEQLTTVIKEGTR